MSTLTKEDFVEIVCDRFRHEAIMIAQQNTDIDTADKLFVMAIIKLSVGGMMNHLQSVKRRRESTSKQNVQ
jgi:hypothetical protein